MKLIKGLLVIALVSLIAVSCKKEKKEVEEIAEVTETIEVVEEAEVVNDSIAVVSDSIVKTVEVEEVKKEVE